MRHWALLVVALVALPANAGAGVYGYSTYGEPPVLLRFDLTAGLVEFVGGVGEDHYISGLAFTSDGLLYGIDPFGDRLMLIDPSTGVGTFVGSLRIDVGSHADLTGGKGGELWLLDDTTSRLYRVDRTTGALYLHCQAVPAAVARGLVSRGGVLYAATREAGVAPGCGMIPFFVGDPPWAGGEFPEVGPDGYAYMWVDNIWGGSELVKIDLDSGAKYMTPVWALFGGGYGGSAFPPQIQAGPAIPALGVSSMAALVILLGLAGVLALRRSL